jgi:hypothetical protein
LKLLLRKLSVQTHNFYGSQYSTPNLLCDMFKIFDRNNSYDVTFWCLFEHAFFLMVRKSNLVPDSVHSHWLLLFPLSYRKCRTILRNKNQNCIVLNHLILTNNSPAFYAEVPTELIQLYVD